MTTVGFSESCATEYSTLATFEAETESRPIGKINTRSQRQKG